MSKMTVKKYPCANCGKIGIAATMVYSSYTHDRYCRDLDACRKRTLARRRKEST